MYIIMNKPESIIKLNEAIKEAEGRATARVITAGGVLRMLERVEDYLDIPKKYLDGVEVEADINAQHFPSAYKYIPESTQFKAVYKRGAWRITAVYRAQVKGPTMAAAIKLTEEAREAIIKRAQHMEV